MMMTKPASKEEEESPPPAFATKPVSAPATKKDPQAAVEDLERRLALLGNGDGDATTASPGQVKEEQKLPAGSTEPSPAFAPTAASAAPTAVKGGKNALLARIMAAQERTRQAAEAKSVESKAGDEPPDLLMSFDDPMSDSNPPPPAFEDVNLLPPPDMPPPSIGDVPPPFESVDQSSFFTPPPPIDAVVPPPPSAPMFAPSAPSFEDLIQAPPGPSSYDGMQAVPPPSQPEIDEDVLGALDPAERAALLEEQRQIMEQIEKNKASNQASSAAARALAFDQRSAPAVARAAAAMDHPTRRPVSSSSSRTTSNRGASSSSSSRTVDLGAGEAVPLHGQESTQQAIKDGTAILVQCVNCQNWMQVTNSATLMFCPVCQVVSPVDKDAATLSNEQVAQMDADQKLAEQLQREEYKQAGVDREERRSRSQQQQQQRSQAGETEGQSWYDWLVGNPKPAPAPAASRPTQSSPPRTSGGLISAFTGEESSSPYASNYRSNTSSSGDGGGGARVAEQKSMFACVADSISTAATSITAHHLTEDPEGNVHGVDSSSLLAMPQVSRQRD